MLTEKKTNKVVVAMSGGVDSAVTAHLMKEQGFDVIGVTLRLAPDSKKTAVTGRCCSLDDMSDARQVCDKIGIPFYAIDARDRFKETVFDPFVKAYERGITPIPCLACNHEVKFGDLFATAKKLNARLATGHYAKVVEYQRQNTLARPYDLERDQTYYLYGTDPEVLDHLLLPLGELAKPQVRKIAQDIGLIVHDKKDSHEICFVPDGNHAQVVEKALNKTFAGDIVNTSGEKLGTHKGVHQFTIGQRRGLGVSSDDRLFVADIDASSQKVILANKASLSCTKVAANDLRLLVDIEKWPKIVQVKIRARSNAEEAKVTQVDLIQKTIYFEFTNPVYAVALGQAAVVYDGDIVLGGGILSARLDGMFQRKMIGNIC